MGKTVAVVGDLYNQKPSISHAWGSSAPFPVGPCNLSIPYSLQSFVRINGAPVIVVGVTRISSCFPCPMITAGHSPLIRINRIPICRQGDIETGPHPFGGIITHRQSIVRSD